MPGIYIPGMEMPKKQTTFTIFPNGYVAIYDAKDSFIGETKAVPVPDHGRLGDLEALWEAAYKAWGTEYDPWVCGLFMEMISSATTIIPADKEE